MRTSILHLNSGEKLRLLRLMERESRFQFGSTTRARLKIKVHEIEKVAGRSPFECKSLFSPCILAEASLELTADDFKDCAVV